MIPEILTRPRMEGHAPSCPKLTTKTHRPRIALPNSKKVYIAGQLHPDIRIPFREISLAPTKTMSGAMEVNEPVRVYDTSGPWGDPSVTLDPIQGLPPLRRDWILKRGDVEEIVGRTVQPIDDGYLSVAHAEHAAKRNATQGAGSRERGKLRSSKLQAPGSTTLRAKPGKVRDAALVCAPGNHHAGNGIYCDSGKPPNRK